jgi:hypothetical protein
MEGCTVQNNSNRNLDHLSQMIQHFFPYAQEKLGFFKPVMVSFQSDEENASKILGRTAHYNPDDFSIAIYVDERHPKDILRSFSHELVHHAQNCNGDFESTGNLGPGYAQENEAMRNAELDAYKRGNIIFRDFEDLIKKGDIEIEIDFEKAGEPKMSLKEWKNNELNGLLMEKWGYRVQKEEQEIFAPNHYCAHHVRENISGREGRCVDHNWNEQLQEVTAYEVDFGDNDIRTLRVEDLTILEASLPEGHQGHMAREEDEPALDEAAEDIGSEESDDEKGNRPSFAKKMGLDEESKLEEWDLGLPRLPGRGIGPDPEDLAWQSLTPYTKPREEVDVWGPTDLPLAFGGVDVGGSGTVPKNPAKEKDPKKRRRKMQIAADQGKISSQEYADFVNTELAGGGQDEEALAGRKKQQESKEQGPETLEEWELPGWLGGRDWKPGRRTGTMPRNPEGPANPSELEEPLAGGMSDEDVASGGLRGIRRQATIKEAKELQETRRMLKMSGLAGSAWEVDEGVIVPGKQFYRGPINTAGQKAANQAAAVDDASRRVPGSPRGGTDPRVVGAKSTKTHTPEEGPAHAGTADRRALAAQKKAAAEASEPEEQTQEREISGGKWTDTGEALSAEEMQQEFGSGQGTARSTAKKQGTYKRFGSPVKMSAQQSAKKQKSSMKRESITLDQARTVAQRIFERLNEQGPLADPLIDLEARAPAWSGRQAERAAAEAAAAEAADAKARAEIGRMALDREIASTGFRKHLGKKFPDTNPYKFGTGLDRESRPPGWADRDERNLQRAVDKRSAKMWAQEQAWKEAGMRGSPHDVGSGLRGWDPKAPTKRGAFMRKGLPAAAGLGAYGAASEIGAEEGWLPTKSSGEGYGIGDFLDQDLFPSTDVGGDISGLQANPEVRWNPYRSDTWNIAQGRDPDDK